MPMIMLLNLKGGVAKTTNTVGIAEYFASQGKQVLVIDADHQSLAGELMLGEDQLLRVENKRHTLHDLLAFMLSDDFTVDAMGAYVTKEASNVEELKEKIDCIACSHRIDDFTTNMAKARRGFQSNDEFLRKLNRLRSIFSRWCNQNYDYAIIDCPPSFALQVLFLLGCADYFIVPSIPDRLSVRGSIYLMDRIKLRGYSKIQCLGTLWSMVRVQVKKHLEIMEEVKKGNGEYQTMPRPFSTYIPNSSAIADAMDSRVEYETIKQKYKTEVLGLYKDLCKEIEERSNDSSSKKISSI